MTSITYLSTSSPSAQETALSGYLLGHAEALVSSAALLGGQPAVRRTERLLDDMASTPALSNRTRRELVGLHRLLSFEFVDGPDSLEAACFSEIDPSWSIVEEICLLSDALLSPLRAIAETEHGDLVWEEFFTAA